MHLIGVEMAWGCFSGLNEPPETYPHLFQTNLVVFVDPGRVRGRGAILILSWNRCFPLGTKQYGEYLTC